MTTNTQKKTDRKVNEAKAILKGSASSSIEADIAKNWKEYAKHNNQATENRNKAQISMWLGTCGFIAYKFNNPKFCKADVLPAVTEKVTTGKGKKKTTELVIVEDAGKFNYGMKKGTADRVYKVCAYEEVQEIVTTFATSEPTVEINTETIHSLFKAIGVTSFGKAQEKFATKQNIELTKQQEATYAELGQFAETKRSDHNKSCPNDQRSRDSWPTEKLARHLKKLAIVLTPEATTNK